MSRAEVLRRRAAMCALYGKVPVREIARRFNVQSPAVFKALRAAGVLAPYRRRGPGAMVRGPRFEAIGDVPESQYVSRDPCPRCGTRRDVGCAHGSARLATGFSL